MTTAEVLRYANEGPAHAATMTYDEVRPMPSIDNAPGDFHWTGDCSCWDTTCCKWGDAPDPNRRAPGEPQYDGWGYTGTIMSNPRNKVVKVATAGKTLVVYGVYPGVHTAVCVSDGADPMTSSMGHPGCPEFVTVSADGQWPVTFYDIDTGDPQEVRAGSIAAKVPSKYWPTGPAPLLSEGATEPHDWIVFLHRILRVEGQYPLRWWLSAGFGARTYRGVLTVQLMLGLEGTGVADDAFWDRVGVLV